MSLAQKTDRPGTEAIDNWRPQISLNNVRLRAQILQQIRAFFAERDVLEVETPLLCHATATDPHLHSFALQHTQLGRLFLQTSPEFAMKRLLASGSGSIYQICKAFRDDEIGRHHNPEFTMLEWYRVGFDHHQLMDEMDALLQQILAVKPAERITFRDVFWREFEIDPLHCEIENLQQLAQKHNIHFDSSQEFSQIESSTNIEGTQANPSKPTSHSQKSEIINHDKPLNSQYVGDGVKSTQNLDKRNQTNVIKHELAVNMERDTWLQLLFTHCIEPNLGIERPSFIYDYPASQAQLSKIRYEDPPVAERFEVYVKGIELANGYHELTDADEQRQRFLADNHTRHNMSLPQLPVPHKLLAALESGLPACSGVALGVDRLIMLAANANHIEQTISFTQEGA